MEVAPETTVSWMSTYVRNVPSIIQFKDGPFGLSAYATRDIEPGTEILALPYTRVLSEKYAVTTAVGGAIHKLLAAAQPSILTPSRLALYFVMLFERDFAEPCAFQPYLRSLPIVFEDPLWWTPDELNALQGTNMLAAVREKREWLLRALAVVNDAFVPGTTAWSRAFSYEELRWAHSAFTSRAFPHMLSEAASPIADTTFVGCMLPVLDILNHRTQTPISWVRKETEVAFVVHSSIPKGDEIFNNYGPKSNEEFLMGYGFTLPDNPFDTVTVALGSTGPPNSARQFVCRRSLDELSPAIPRELREAVTHMLVSSSAQEGDASSQVVLEQRASHHLLFLFFHKLLALVTTHPWLLELDKDVSRLELRSKLAAHYVQGQARVFTECLRELCSFAKARVSTVPAHAVGVPPLHDVIPRSSVAYISCSFKEIEVGIKRSIRPTERNRCWVATSTAAARSTLCYVDGSDIICVPTIAAHDAEFAGALRELGLWRDSSFDRQTEQTILMLFLLLQYADSSSRWYTFTRWAFDEFARERADQYTADVEEFLSGQPAGFRESCEEYLAFQRECLEDLVDSCVKPVREALQHRFPGKQKIFSKARVETAQRIVNALAMAASTHGSVNLVIVPLASLPKTCGDGACWTWPGNCQWEINSDATGLQLIATQEVHGGAELYWNPCAQPQCVLLQLPTDKRATVSDWFLAFSPLSHDVDALQDLLAPQDFEVSFLRRFVRPCSRAVRRSPDVLETCT